MSSRRSRGPLIGLVIGVPIGLVFLWLAVRDADLELVRQSLQEADVGLVVLAVVAFGAVYGFQSVRWRRIASTRQVRLARFYEMTVSGVACNNVLPGRIGDLLRARWLGLEARMPAGRAFGTVILDRACDLVVPVDLLVIGIAANGCDVRRCPRMRAVTLTIPSAHDTPPLRGATEPLGRA